jgi:hypothetical protein
MSIVEASPATVTNIVCIDSATVEVGDLVEQSGVIYSVTAVHPSPVRAGVGAIDLRWTGANESDVFRSAVNGNGWAGQIRWHSPYRAPEVSV